jgi:hypothetical protein
MEQSLVILQSNLQAAKAQDEKNDGEVQTLRRLLERAEVEKEKTKKAVLEAQATLDQAKTPVNYVRVSDNHSNCKPRKTYVDLYVKKGFYLVCLNGKNEENFRGVTSNISTRRKNSVENIKLGTVLVMADTLNKKIYKGIVRSNGNEKYYSPETGYDGIFDYIPLEYMTINEIRGKDSRMKIKRWEITWTVDWTIVDNLTAAWTNILNPSIRATAFPLDPASFPKQIV